MLYLLFFVYLAAFCLLVGRIPFFKKSGLTYAILISLFIIKVAVSVLVTYVFLNYHPGSDVAFFHKYGLLEQQLLLDHPRQYFENLFLPGYSTGYSGFFATKNSYWNNLSPNIIIKLLSLFNFVSGGNVYINALFFNFLTFFAPVALFRVFKHAFAMPRIALIICLFLLPSAVVFTSIVHKEGLIFLGISMIVFHIYFSTKNGFRAKNAAIVVFYLLLIFSLRNYVFLALAPALVCWVISAKWPGRSILIFGSVYLFLLFIFFTSPYLLSINFMELLTVRRLAFEEISGSASTVITPRQLEPTIVSFIKNFPPAVSDALFKPQLFQSFKLYYLPFQAEVLLFEILLVFLLFFKQKVQLQPLAFFFVFFSISMLLITGFTIPVVGAIVRYRSSYYMFLFVILANHIDWRKIFQRINIK